MTETAQDVLHDGFLNIFRSFDKFTYKRKGSLKAWLARVMVNEEICKTVFSNQIVVEELHRIWWMEILLHGDRSSVWDTVYKRIAGRLSHRLIYMYLKKGHRK